MRPSRRTADRDRYPYVDLAKSSALHARARAFVAAFEDGRDAPEDFAALAGDIARYQVENVDGYARLVKARGIATAVLGDVATLPAVPTDAFKVTRVAAFDESETKAVFRTSGTTIGARGSHAMRDVSTYDAAAVAFGRRWLARDLANRVPVIVLGPSPDDAPDSSLVHMCAAFALAFGTEAAVSDVFVVQDEVIDATRFDERVAIALAEEQPMLVLATSFALVHFLEGMDEIEFPLPAGSRVMQTGGFKGKSREVEPAKLRSEIARVFRVPERAIVSEYGMTELSSQFYERTLFDDAAKPGVYAEPPWARVVPVDPETLEPVKDGEVGIAKIVDLMNVDSAVAVLAADRVRRVDAESFELLGRSPGAPPRGCSIAIDELLGR
jgi:hypothetical protein